MNLNKNKITKFFLSFTRQLCVSTAAFFLLCTVVHAQDYGDAFVTSIASDARTLIPILASDSVSAEVCGLIYNGLVKYDKDINLTGDLAEKWDISSDNLTITFHLRKGVFWHDGVEFSADDVIFTYNKLIDPNVRTPYSGDFMRIESVKALDRYTLRVTYKEPFSPALSSWGMSIMPKHIFEKEDFYRSTFSRNPIGTGSFKFKSWKTQEKVELTVNEKYFEGRPYLDRYIFRILPDPSSRFLELQTQGLDSSSITALEYHRQTQTQRFKDIFQKFRLPSFSYTYMGYKLNDPLFSDVRVRQALNLAVDKNELIQIVLLGLGKPITGPFVPDSWAYNPDVVAVSKDLEHAKKLLHEAGWVDVDKDGVLKKGNTRFEFTLLTNQGNEERIKAAQVIQRSLKEIGVRVKIKVVEWSVFLDQHIAKRNFQAVLLGWSLTRDPDNYDIWHSSKTKEGEFNFIGYNNPLVDELLTKARQTFDVNLRRDYYRQIHAQIYKDQPCMFLYSADSLFVINRRFMNVRQAPLGVGYNFKDWWVPKKQQKYNTMLR